MNITQPAPSKPENGRRNSRPFANFKPGEQKPSYHGFNNPVDWIQHGIIEFMDMTEMAIPKEFSSHLSLTPNLLNIHSATNGLKAINSAIDFYSRSDRPFVKADTVSSLDQWYLDALLEFLEVSFRVIPKEWSRKNQTLTDRAFRAHRIEALKRCKAQLEKIISQL